MTSHHDPPLAWTADCTPWLCDEAMVEHALIQLPADCSDRPEDEPWFGEIPAAGAWC